MTTLFNIYEATIENASMNDLDVTAKEFESYAEGALGIYLSQEQVETLFACHREFSSKGDGANDFYHMVEAKLQETVQG